MNDYQKSIFDGERVSPDSAVYNIGGIIPFSVPMSYEMLSDIINEIIEKTEALRLRLNKKGELYLHTEKEYIMPHYNIEGDLNAAKEFASELFKEPFDSIYDRNLFDIAFIEYADGSVGFLKLHHILGDAASIVVLCKKVEEGYFNRIGKEKAAIDVKPTEYTVMSTARAERAKEYFSKRLENLPDIRLSENVERDNRARVIRFCTELKKGESSRFFAALYVYLSAVTDSKKVVIGNVLGNRNKSQLDMFGMFANTLPLVMESQRDSLESLCENIKAEQLALMKYSAYPLRQLTDDLEIKESLFEIAVSYKTDKFLPKINIGEVIEIENGCVDMPIRIFAEERGDKLYFNIHYKTALFDKRQIEAMGKTIGAIYESEKDSISELSVLSDYDKEIYKKLCDTNKKHKFKDIIECFKAHISDNEAVIYNNEGISFKELDRRSDFVASYIKDKAAYTVGVKTGRCIEMIISVLGILKAGAAFVMVSDSIPGSEKICDILLTKNDVIDIEEKPFIMPKYSSEDTAYYVFTSGTTGEPKCIAISRGSLISRLEWANDKFGLKGSILQKTINTFDVSIWEMLSFIYGARVCILSEGDEGFPDRIADAMLKYEVNILHFVPSMLKPFIKYAGQEKIVFPHLKAVFASGEKLSAGTVREFYDTFSAKLYNLYGPSECTIDVSGYECRGDERDVPIGTPAHNTQIYILNSEDKIMPVNIKGEICITGELVGKGYTGSDKGGYFTFKGKKAYRTGDIGKIGFDGNIYIYGRWDSQIKIRGMRIDLNAVSSLISGYKNVDESVVLKDRNRLVCFYSGSCESDEIREYLSDKIQSFAIPTLIRRISEIPLTPSGKTDAKKLLECLKTQTDTNLSDREKTILALVRKYIDADINDNLFNLGLDSLSVVEIVCELKELGIDVSFGDFYEGLSVKGISRLIDKKIHTIWLQRQSAKRLLVCFPYGGGEPQAFKDLCRLPGCDVLGVYISSFEADTEIGEIADYIFKFLSGYKYDEIYIYGHCVGCAPAWELADRLGNLKGLILGSPSVSKGVPVLGSPWHALPDDVIAGVLGSAGGSKVFNRAAIKRFRIDTDRYFKYMKKSRSIKLFCNVTIIFGRKDPFTKNQNSIIKRLKDFIKGEYNIYVIEEGDHYFTQTHTDEFYNIIKNTVIGGKLCD